MPKENKNERQLIKSKVAQYEDKILDQIDSLISKGGGAISCLKVISLNYKGPLVPPSRDTMEKYIRRRKEQLGVKTDKRIAAEQAFLALNPLPDIRTIDLTDKRATLGAILQQLAARVEVIKDIQEGQSDARYEKILADALAEMRETVAMQADMDNKLGLERTRLQAIVNVLLRHISATVSQAYKDVHGDEKLDAFVKALEKRLDSLPFDVIESEVLSVVTEQNVIEEGGAT